MKFDELADDLQAKWIASVEKHWGGHLTPDDAWDRMGDEQQKNWWCDQLEKPSTGFRGFYDEESYIDNDRSRIGELVSFTANAIRTAVGRFRHTADEDDGNRRLEVEWLDGITPEPVKWRWEGRMAAGEITLLAGREGEGKSTIAYDLAASITRGTLPGDLFGKPANVLIAAAEDSFKHTIVPRLMAAGADMSKMGRIQVLDLDVLTSDQIDLPTDLDRLRDLIDRENVALVLLDPLVSRLGSSLDTHKDADVRRALEPLKRIADDTSCAILGVIHLNKSGGQDPLNQVMGSRAFGAVARSTLFAMKSPSDDDAHLLGNPKNNLGKQATTLSYRVIGHQVTDTDDGEAIWTAKIQWTGETDQSIHDALSEADAGEPAGSTQDAVTWLRDYLTDSGGGAEASAAKKHGKESGHNERTLTRARQKLGVTAENQKGSFPRKTYWILPAGSPS